MKLEYVKVGKSKKPHGVEGGLRMHIEENMIAEVMNAEVLFLLVDGREAPFFVDLIVNDSPLVIKFEEVDSREDAFRLVNKEVYMRKTDIQEEVVLETPGFRQMEGFTIEDTQIGIIGTIEQIVELPEQLMAIINKEGRDVLIPLNDQFIQDIKAEEKKIIMDLPEGLLDLY